MAAVEILDKEMKENEPNMTSADVSGEGARMKTLRRVMQDTTKSYIANLKLIKPLKNVSRAHLEVLHKKTLSQLESNIQCELEQMYKEENLEVLLNSLDKLIAENPPSMDKPTWRPSGNVQRDISSEVAILKREKLKVLEKTLGDLEAQNKMLIDRVQKGEQQLLRARDKIVAIVDDVEQIVDRETSIIQPEQTERKGSSSTMQ